MTDDLKRGNLQITCNNADDYYALYRAGYYVNINQETREFYWDHNDDRYLIFMDDRTAERAERLKKEVKGSFKLAFCKNSGLVLDHLQDLNIKQKTWVTNQVRDIYEALLYREYAFSVEVYKGDLLVGGLFGVAFGQLVILDTMYGLPLPVVLRSTSKLALCETIVQLHAAGIKIVDVEVKHKLNHPACRLGEQRVTMEEYRRILLEYASGGPELLRKHLSRCWTC